MDKVMALFLLVGLAATGETIISFLPYCGGTIDIL
ncbi:hypothetical protein X773_04580 [Mesorhizobium sp. LSJC285A00]|nr:hypothetical protein X773_04580 [Mesorhizobium sp. LSJC285A00]ESY32775.1 hypothetical protein X749_05260 [Mesorhizobium sp. LNJC391B00]